MVEMAMRPSGLVGERREGWRGGGGVPSGERCEEVRSWSSGSESLSGCGLLSWLWVGGDDDEERAGKSNICGC
jgi:hypothetical protein